MQRADAFVEGLDAQLELERAGRETGDHLAQALGQAVGHQLEMKEPARLMACEEEFEDGAAGLDVEVEGAVHKFELPDAACQQVLEVGKQGRQWRLAHRDVERGKAKLAGERAAARGLDVDDPVGDVPVIIEVVGQSQL